MIREVAALLRFHWLEGAIVADEEMAFAVRLVDESEAVAIGTQASVTLDEVAFVEADVAGDGPDLGFGDFHEAGPAATRGTTLAMVVNGLGHQGFFAFFFIFICCFLFDEDEEKDEEFSTVERERSESEIRENL